eukprot:gene9553-10371_t
MQNQEILELANLRIDGRQFDQIRKLKHNIGLIPKADGSAYLEHGLNKVLVILNGPQEIRKRSDGRERKVRKPGDRRVIEMEHNITEVLESIVMLDLYPKSEIQLTVHILENDGSVFCTVVNAIYLALMTAGISMYDSFIACSVGYLYHNSQIITDLNQLEIFGNENTIYLPLVMKGKSEEVIFMECNHRCQLNLVEELLQQAIVGCRSMRSYFETAIKEYMLSQLENQV